jgi:hypothetical protein
MTRASHCSNRTLHRIVGFVSLLDRLIPQALTYSGLFASLPKLIMQRSKKETQCLIEL